MIHAVDSAANRTPAAALATVRFHASLNVSNLDASIRFYSALFGQPPVKAHPDYAKFEIDTPPLVLSLKPKRACAGGPLNHLGIRLTSLAELEVVLERMRAVTTRIGRQDEVRCCYAKQTKLWITDPDGTLWEIYVFHDDVVNWGERHNKLKLWSAPLKAFGVRGVLRRWWNNAFGSRSSAADNERLITEETTEATPGLSEPPSGASGGAPAADVSEGVEGALGSGSSTASACSVPAQVLRGVERQANR